MTIFLSLNINGRKTAPAISGEKLKEKFKNFSNIQYKKSIKEAIESLQLEEDDLLVITGSLYLSGEFLNLN